MGFLDKLFGKKEVPSEPVKETVAPAMPKVKKPRKPKEKKPEPVMSAKDKATQAGEPYVNVLGMEIDPANIHDGSFELDWNEIFIAKLVKTGYMKSKEDTDRDIIDRWFQDVCRTIVLEMYEQQDADPSNRDVRNVVTRDLGNGRTEVS
jgi:hypothetical protein